MEICSLLQIINQLLASQHHLPFDAFLQKIGEKFTVERAAIYYNRLDYHWQLIALRMCEWSRSSSPNFPDIIEYKKVFPAIEIKLSNNPWVVLDAREIEMLGFIDHIEHNFFSFPLFEGKWWNGLLFLDFGRYRPSEEELSIIHTICNTLSIVITRHKRETEYLETTRVFQELLNNIPEMVLLTDLHERWLLANNKTLEVFNFKRQVYQGRTFDELIQMKPEHSSLLKQLRSLLQKLSYQGSPLHETIRIGHQERPMWISFLLIPFFCDAQKRVLILGRDITSIKLAQERMIAILENLPAIVYITHPASGEILYHNSSFREYFGKDLVGRGPCYKLLFNRESPCGFCHLKEAPYSLKEVREVYDKIKNRWLRIHEVYISWIDREIVRLGMIQDITEEKQQEENLIQSQKLEILGRLTGNIAHEFNNVLAIINGYIDLIRYHARSKKIEDYVTKIQKAVNSGSSLIKQLLVFSRKRLSKEKAISDLNRMIREQAEVLKKLVGENIEFELSLSQETLLVNLSFEDLQHILTNLILNARDAMPGGGKLSINTELVKIPQRGEYALIKVSDTGKGISSESLARIFDPFYTTKPSGKGTGLGLTIILSVVRKVGGEIKVASELQKGTTFEILLPLVLSEMSRQKEENRLVADSEDSEVRDVKILVVEDEPHIREMLVEMLEGKGFKVAMAEDGERALKWLRENDYGVELIITDVVMPRMDGVKLYRTLRKEAPQIRILFISGYAQHILEKYGFNERNFSILKKPFTFNQLIEEIKRSLTIQTSFSQ